ncbi:MAG: hypothetical protein WD044_00635 [Dongiaceae bacterium]
MIHYCVARDHRYTIDLLKGHVRGQLDDTVVVNLYGTPELFQVAPDQNRPVFIFTDLDRLAVPSVLAKKWQAFQASTPAALCLNHPTRTLIRFELLKSLYRAKINRFDVHAAVDLDLPMRFPVFVRARGGHEGALTRLLNNKAEVAHAIELLRESRSMQEMMIVEYRDTADSGGIFRKYSAYLVGDSFFPHHIQFSREWMIKRSTLEDEQYLKEELDYVRLGDPYESRLRAVFAMAGIGYGRIDYSIDESGPQIWEINTNPMIVGENNPTGYRLEARDLVVANMVQAFRRLAVAPPAIG